MRIGSKLQWGKYIAKLSTTKFTKRVERGNKSLLKTEKWTTVYRQRLGSVYSSALLSRPTPEEIMFGNLLCELNLFPFEFQRQILTPKFYILDFCLPKSFVAFEIDGKGHNVKKDEVRDKILQQARGMKTYRFKNSMFRNQLDDIKQKVLEAKSWGGNIEWQ